MNKTSALAKIAKEIEKCWECKIDKTGKPVSGEGSPDAKIIFIGEAPGREEAKTGRPFVGRSGKLLRQLIREIGLEETEVYITSPVKYLPKSGTPSKKDIIHGCEHLVKQLDIIKPKLIVLLGSVACQAILGQKIAIIKRHGEVIKKGRKTYFITLHPAAAVRFVKFRQILKVDFKNLKSILNSWSLKFP